MKRILILMCTMFFVLAAIPEVKSQDFPGVLKVSPNGHYFTDEKGNPFFWLGDTGWGMLGKLTRGETIYYLDTRAKQGFNVIQVNPLMFPMTKNIYGDPALVDGDLFHPLVTEGSSFEDTKEYDFWDHVDFVFKEAGKRGIYMAIVPIWGNNIRDSIVNGDKAVAFTTFLAKRYKDFENIIWLNGGDVFGTISTEIWNRMGAVMKEYTPDKLVTFHPYGRMMSSMWFQNADWLDFNMFQSGHRRYDQDDTELCYGEDNWRYVNTDFNSTPTRPVLDGEPSYENILQGLHDDTQPRWRDKDARRYAYWSVFAGSAGHTYGNNTVFQFINPNDQRRGFGAEGFWTDALYDKGGSQLIYLKKLILSRPYFERIPDQSLVNDKCQGERYDYIVATRGKAYAYFYTFKGKNIAVNMGKIEGKKVKAGWYNPRNGETTEIGIFKNEGLQEFNPPGEVEDGNDWVLILDKI